MTRTVEIDEIKKFSSKSPACMLRINELGEKLERSINHHCNKDWLVFKERSNAFGYSRAILPVRRSEPVPSTVNMGSVKEENRNHEMVTFIRQIP